MSIESVRRSRRKLLGLLAGGASVLYAGQWAKHFLHNPKPRGFSGGMVGGNSKVGHRLRSELQRSPTETKTIEIAIIGGGISGLSAAWWLKKHGLHNFTVFEMDSQAGGNSSSGKNLVSRYPWGAHYVPLPGQDSHYVRELFEEIGLITGYEKGRPVFDEFALCADSNERLLFQGEWQDGLVPLRGVSAADRFQYDEFFAYLETLKSQKGRDGRPVFTIPLDLSSRDPDYLKLDKISMSDFMKQRGWNSAPLNWYVNYCCRDDYGRPHDRVSAWSGLHYFASRAGRGANAEPQSVLTWPEGNGFLVDRLVSMVGNQIEENSLACRIETLKSFCNVDILNVATDVCTRYQAKHVIYCGPRFTAAKVIRDYAPSMKLEYAPWAVANVTLKSKPKSHGQPMSWDNVSYYSPSLGYINANHQDIKVNREEMVLTYYLPLDKLSPKEEREAAYRKSYEDWLDVIVPDLEKMHPGIASTISSLDVWIWGHGMVSPGVDFLWSGQRDELRKPFGRIEFAHSDMSGISIFEEAQFQGVEAAKRVLAKDRS